MSKIIEEEYNVPGEMLMNKALTSTDLRIYVITRIKVREANALGVNFAPDGQAYAEYLGVNIRVLQKSFQKLEHKGYIVREFKDRKRIIHV